MTKSLLIWQRLPMLFVTSVLGAGLLLTGCNKEVDNKDTDSKTEETVTAPTADAAEEKVNTKPATDIVNANDDTMADPNMADPNTINTADVATKPDTSTSEIETVSKTISPIAAATKQPSLLTNPTEKGTAEDTVKLALDTLYYGDVKKAATYYQVDMENFAEELKNTQFAFQQTVESVTITNTKYNKDKTRATVTGELRLKDQDKPAPLTYELHKIKGNWKILG